MFGFGWGEMVVIGIVALIAIGPKELPTVLRTLGQYMGKVRRMANEFQGQFNEALREAELTDLQKHADDITKDISNFDPMADTQKEVEKAFEFQDPMADPVVPTPAVETGAPLPQIEVKLPDAPTPVTEKDFAVSAPAPKPKAKGAGKTAAKPLTKPVTKTGTKTAAKTTTKPGKKKQAGGSA
jgi:sec-independent protein translocase protein TatB